MIYEFGFSFNPYAYEVGVPYYPIGYLPTTKDQREWKDGDGGETRTTMPKMRMINGTSSCMPLPCILFYILSFDC